MMASVRWSKIACAPAKRALSWPHNEFRDDVRCSQLCFVDTHCQSRSFLEDNKHLQTTSSLKDSAITMPENTGFGSI